MALQGFIVATVDDAGSPVSYWDGTEFQAVIDEADFQADKPDARFLQGTNQAQNTEVDVVILDAEVTVTLVP